MPQLLMPPPNERTESLIQQSSELTQPPIDDAAMQSFESWEI